MCTGDPCVWSAVVHTQENIFISTYTRGVQAWFDHERSCDNLFTALTCTDLQISSKRLLFLNFGLEQIQNSKKSGRKKLASHFSRSHFDTWMLPCHPWCHQSIFLWDPPTTNWPPPPPPPLPPVPAPGWGQSVGHEKFGKIRPKMALNGRISWKIQGEIHVTKHWISLLGGSSWMASMINPWRLPFFKIHQLSNTLGGDWVRYGEMLRSKKSFFGPSVCIPVPNQDSTQTHLRSEHFDSSQVLQLNSSYTPLTHETREFYRAFEVHIEPQNAGKISEKQKVLYHIVLAEVWINLVGLWVWLEMISQFLQDIFSPNSTSMNSWFEVEAKTKTPKFPSKDDTPCQAHPKRNYVSSRHVRSACPKSVKLR